MSSLLWSDFIYILLQLLVVVKCLKFGFALFAVLHLSRSFNLDAAVCNAHCYAVSVNKVCVVRAALCFCVLLASRCLNPVTSTGCRHWCQRKSGVSG